MKSPPALVKAFEAAAGSLRGVERRKMFGYPAVFVNGNMFAAFHRDGMVLRLGDGDRDRFLEQPGAKPFVAMGRPMKQWVLVPSAVLRSKPRLRAWLGKALAYGRSLPAKAARRERGRPSRATSRARR